MTVFARHFPPPKSVEEGEPHGLKRVREGRKAHPRTIAGKGMNKVAREAGVVAGIVRRVKDEMKRPFEVAAA